MAKNINSLQLLRNTTQLYATKDAAISGITGSATNDGTIKLARYEVDGKNGKEIRTIFGIYSIGSGITGSLVSGGSYTIYDSPQEVIAELTKRLDTLEGGNDVEGSVAKSIKDAIGALSAATVGGEGQVITAISETDGKISATASALTAGIVAATAIEATDDTVAVSGTNVAAQIASLAQYIGSLDYADSAATEGSYVSKVTETNGKIAVERVELPTVGDTAVSGSYVSAVSETKGRIEVTRAELPTVTEIKSEGQAIVAVKEDKGVISATAGDIAAAHVKIADSGSHFTAETVEAALDELFSKAGDGSKVTLEEAVGTEDGVLKVYTIKQGGSEVGKINIPKDLVVTSGSVVKGNWSVDGVFTESESGTGTALKLIIANQTAPVYINTLDLVKDHTGGNGINISDTNVVSVVVDSQSEKFLTVGEGGVKLSGVQTAIDKAAAKATTKVAKAADADKITLTPSTDESDGSVTYTIGQSDIASASGLTEEVKRAKAAEDKIEASVGLTAEGEHVKTNGNYTSGATTVVGEIAALDTALASEVTVRHNVEGQSGDTYVANSGTSYISGATSLNDADVKLDAAINKEETDRKAEDTKIVAGVGLTLIEGENVYKIAANSGDGVHVTSASTVKDAIYTLDNALAAAKKKNALTAADKTVVVDSNDEGTTVKVNIATAETVTNFVGYAEDGSFIKSEMFGTIDAGTY